MPLPHIFRLLIFLGVACCPFDRAGAEQLPIRPYTTADGLARDLVSCIVPDSRGFLWFCTGEGLSRFDGYSFTSFGRSDGLPGRSVAALIEARDGTIWVGTDEGLTMLDPGSRFRAVSSGPSASPLFKSFKPNGIEGSNNLRTLLETRDGTILVGSFSGLFRFHPDTHRFDKIDLGESAPTEGREQINELLEDERGNVWIATRYLGLLLLHPEGSIEKYLVPVPAPAGNVRALVFDGEGGVWAGGWDGLRHLIPDPGGSGRLLARELYTTADGLADRQVYSLFREPGGQLVVGSAFGIALSTAKSGEKPRFVPIGRKQGLSLVKAISVTEDRSGNIWVGSDGSGAFKLAQTGFTSFDGRDGLPGPYCVSLLHGRDGHLYASTHSMRSETVLSRLGESPFPAFRINVPRRIQGRGWGTAQLTFQDHLGDWWVPTGDGLLRFSGIRRVEELATAAPAAIYTMKDGLPSNEIFRLFEDSRGDVWVVAYGMVRYRRSTGRFETIDVEGQVSFAEDAAGNVWIGGWDGTLRRCRDQCTDLFAPSDGVPQGSIQTIFRDSRNRLWIGSSDGGVARIDEPASPRPVILRPSLSQGLASSQVNAIVEDAWGRIYLGTARGVDRLDPDTGRIRHFTSADGLGGNEIMLADKDASGALWFGTQAGLSKLVPLPPEDRKPPPIWISQLSISGIRQPVNLLGELSLEGLRLESSQRDLEIGFVGLDFSAGEKLRYRYRLEGAEGDWSEPSDRRTVNYANLAPGSYRFAVKALDSDGVDSTGAATVSFTILPPLWERGWFLALFGGLALGSIYALHRYRVSHLLKLERVRTRIAADLHDDIGASLSRIAMQSELVRLPDVIPPPEAQRLLSDIGESARSLVDSMSDIVWSIDPKRDDLASLASRIRQFALGMFEPRGIALDLKVPEDAQEVVLAPEDRRHLLLLIKEAVNNIARHSGCRHVWITLVAEGGRLQVEVRDDGQGMESASSRAGSTGGGHGLGSMAERARQLGGSLSVESSPGEGTTLRLTCVLQHLGA